jgi:hypothetical protein
MFFCWLFRNSKAYRFCNPRNLKISRDAIFNKESTADTPIYYPDQIKCSTKEQSLPSTSVTDPATQDDESDPFHGFEIRYLKIHQKLGTKRFILNGLENQKENGGRSLNQTVQYALHAATHPDIKEPSSCN